MEFACKNSLATLAMMMAAAGVPAVGAATVADTPPMGWNSWDCYGTTVTEAETKANADYMARQLKSHGWQYIVVDIQWSELNPRAHGYRPDAELAIDEYGRLIPAANRFPSSAGGRGFKPLADYIHGLGLKFGIHIMRGIPRRAVKANAPVFGSQAHAAAIADVHSVCPWNSDMYGLDMSRPGAQDYYDSILKMYADWGVDYIKADDIARPAHREEIAGLHRAIQKTGPPIVLSLSPGPAMVKDVAFFQENANLWRISDDFWDDWKALRLNFTLMSLWSGMGRPGAWPDADMLPLGHIGLRAERGDDRMTRFTRDEQRTLMSLWSIAQSPLMFGGDLPGNDEFTLSLITNDEVLAVNQKGAHGAALAEGGSSVIWTADAVGSAAKYVAVFNVGDRGPIDIHVDWGALKLPPTCVLRDLWERKDLGSIEAGYTFHVAAHASGLYKVSPANAASSRNAAPVAPVTVPDWVTLEANIPYDSYPSTVLDVLYPKAAAKGKRPGVIMFHGGGWIRSSKETMMTAFCRPYLERGFVVANVEYRVASAASAPAAVTDALDAAKWFFDHADKYGVDPHRIVVTGASAGGHLALMVGMTPESARLGPSVRVAAIVNGYGVADVADLLDGPHRQGFAVEWLADQPDRLELARRLSPLTYVRKGLPPILTVQGENDHTVPYEQGVRLTKALKEVGADAQMMTVANAGHGFSREQWPDVHARIFEFLAPLMGER